MKTVGFKDDPNLEILYPIIHSLDDLCDSLVFVGGCATGLLLTAERSELIRPTRDVDVIVQATTLGDYHAVEKQVANRGFKHDISDEAPIWLFLPGFSISPNFMRPVGYCLTHAESKR